MYTWIGSVFDNISTDVSARNSKRVSNASFMGVLPSTPPPSIISRELSVSTDNGEYQLEYSLFTVQITVCALSVMKCVYPLYSSSQLCMYNVCIFTMVFVSQTLMECCPRLCLLAILRLLWTYASVLIEWWAKYKNESILCFDIQRNSVLLH